LWGTWIVCEGLTATPLIARIFKKIKRKLIFLIVGIEKKLEREGYFDIDIPTEGIQDILIPDTYFQASHPV